jgi:hypothetical protein
MLARTETFRAAAVAAAGAFALDGAAALVHKPTLGTAWGNLAVPVGSGSGAGRVVMLLVAAAGSETTPTPTLNGFAGRRVTAADAILTPNQTAWVFLWFDGDLPGSAGTYTLVPGLASGEVGALYAQAFRGARQTMPPATRSMLTAVQAVTTALTPGAAGGFFYDALSLGDARTMTVGAGQTVLLNENTSDGSNTFAFSRKAIAATAQTTMGWSAFISTSSGLPADTNRVLHPVISIEPAAAPPPPPPPASETILMPPTDPAAWTDHGVAIAAGATGQWDARLAGMMTPCGVVRRAGTLYLYYLGASGNRTSDAGPAFRALGVATSADGVTWTKHAGNPIVTHLPQGAGGVNNSEEGVFSASAWYDQGDGQFRLTWGGMEATSASEVRIDAYRSLSTDGLTYANNTAGSRTLILSATDGTFAGNDGDGDETFPAALWRHTTGEWLQYYTTKNTPDDHWRLNVAHSFSLTALDGDLSERFLAVSTNPLGGDYRHMSLVDRGQPSGALTAFVIAHNAGFNDSNQTQIQAREVPIETPGEPGPIVWTFPIAGRFMAIVHLDRTLGKWFMYYRDEANNQGAIRVRSTPAVAAGSGGGGSGAWRVAQSGDDAEQSVSSGTVSIVSSDLELPRDGTTEQLVGMRFVTTIPQGASINTAHIQFTADGDFSGTLHLRFRAELSANAATFAASANNISSRTLSTTTITWIDVPAWASGAAGSAQRTPNLAALVEQVVSQPGFAGPVVLVVDRATGDTGTALRRAESFDGAVAAGNPALAPLLEVTWTV